MPVPADAETTLKVLFEHGDRRDNDVIRDVAIRAGLLQRCRCGGHNPVGADRCDTCDARVLPAAPPQTVPALCLVAVRDYLTVAYGEEDGDARFVTGCRTGLCGDLALDVAAETLADAEEFGYGRAWTIIAEEIIAGIEARATTVA